MNAHAKIADTAAPPSIGTPLPDGSLVITAEQLAWIGNGDAKRGRRELRLLLECERDTPVYNGPTDKPASVRIAAPKDEPALLALILMDVEENAKHIAPINEARILAHIQSATQGKGAIIGVIDGPDKTPVAVTMLLPCQWWFSKAYFFNEALNFVHPDHRKTRHIHDLMQFGRWAGDHMTKESGFRVWVLFSVLGTKRVREKVLLYKRKLAEAGRLFMYPNPAIGED